MKDETRALVAELDNICECALYPDIECPQCRAAQLLTTQAAEIERLRGLVKSMLENDPDDDAADGVTVLMAWRKEARQALEGET